MIKEGIDLYAKLNETNIEKTGDPKQQSTPLDIKQLLNEKFCEFENKFNRLSEQNVTTVRI